MSASSTPPRVAVARIAALSPVYIDATARAKGLALLPPTLQSVIYIGERAINILNMFC